MTHGAGHPGQPGDHEFVAGAQVIEARVPLRAASQPPGGRVGPDAFAPGGAQRVELGVITL